MRLGFLIFLFGAAFNTRAFALGASDTNENANAPALSAEILTEDEQLSGLEVIGACGEDCLVVRGESQSDLLASRGQVHLHHAVHPKSSCHQQGIASTYNTGHITANGERPNWSALAAANKTLPFNTRVRVTNHRNGNSVIVRINDRGPYVAGRIIDLTPAAAHAIGMGDGLAPVTIECL